MKSLIVDFKHYRALAQVQRSLQEKADSTILDQSEMILQRREPLYSGLITFQKTRRARMQHRHFRFGVGQSNLRDKRCEACVTE